MWETIWLKWSFGVSKGVLWWLWWLKGLASTCKLGHRRSQNGKLGRVAGCKHVLKKQEDNCPHEWQRGWLLGLLPLMCSNHRTFAAYPKKEGCHCQKATMVVAPTIDKMVQPMCYHHLCHNLWPLICHELPINTGIIWEQNERERECSQRCEKYRTSSSCHCSTEKREIEWGWELLKSERFLLLYCCKSCSLPI